MNERRPLPLPLLHSAVAFALLFGTMAYWRLQAPKPEPLSPTEVRRRALITAVQMGDLEQTRNLLASGGDPNTLWTTAEPQGLDVHAREIARSRRRYAGTPLLQIAVRNRNLPMARLLLQRGARVNERGRLDYTALMYAASFGRADLCRLLLDRGADPNARDAVVGMTPLMLAVQSVNRRGLPTSAQPVETVALLLARGAKRDARDRHGRSALDWAQRSRRREVGRMLLTPSPASRDRAAKPRHQ